MPTNTVEMPSSSGVSSHKVMEFSKALHKEELEESMAAICVSLFQI